MSGRLHACGVSLLLMGLSGVSAGEEPVALPPVTVRAPRFGGTRDTLPAPVSVVERNTIRSGTLGIALDEPLRNVPGVFVLNPANFAQDTRIAIRGSGARADFGIRGIRLIVDGLPATTPDGQGEVDGIDLGATERIEVLRGPASALYGAASGGVIRIETERGSHPPYAETRLVAGDHRLRRLQVATGGAWEDASIRVGGSDLDYEGYREHSHTRGRRLTVISETGATADSRWTVVLHALDFPQQDDPGGLTLEEAEADPSQARARNVRYHAGEEVTQQRVGLIWTRALPRERELTLRTAYTHRDFANRLPFEAGGQVTYDRRFPHASLLFREEEGRFRSSVGVDVDVQSDHRIRYDNLEGARGPESLNQEENVRGVGVFWVPELTLAPAWTATAAVRYDRVRFEVDDRFFADGDDSGRRTFEEISPMAGLRWTPRKGANAYLSLSRAFETPTTTELDNPQGGGFNPDLDSQTATSVEIGVKGTLNPGEVGMRYDFALFRMRTEDELIPYELEPFPGREFYRNAGGGVRTGLEARVEVKPHPRWRATAHYTASDFRYDDFVTEDGDFSGNTLPGIPDHFGGLEVGYREPRGGFAELSTRWVGSMVADDGNQTRVDASTTTDLRVGVERRSGPWSVAPFVGLRNLFNASTFANIRINAFGDRYYEPASDRSWYAGVRVRYAFR